MALPKARGGTSVTLHLHVPDVDAAVARAVEAGARQPEACEVLGITGRTLRRWRSGGENLTDRRKGADKHCPHALGEVDRDRIVAVCNQPEFQSLPPSQIVPRLAGSVTV